jgi:hypothetical protein
MMVKEICKFCVLIAFLGVSLISKAQTINYVEEKYQADVNVYLVNWKYQADAVVYITPYRSYSREEGVWWVSKGHYQKGVKVRIVKYKHQADVLVYLTEWRYQVRVNECYKRYFR